MTRCPVIGDEAITGVRRLLLQHGVQTNDPARQVLSTRAPDRNTVTTAAHLRSRDVQDEEPKRSPYRTAETVAAGWPSTFNTKKPYGSAARKVPASWRPGFQPSLAAQ